MRVVCVARTFPFSHTLHKHHSRRRTTNNYPNGLYKAHSKCHFRNTAPTWCSYVYVCMRGQYQVSLYLCLLLLLVYPPTLVSPVLVVVTSHTLLCSSTGLTSLQPVLCRCMGSRAQHYTLLHLASYVPKPFLFFSITEPM